MSFRFRRHHIDSKARKYQDGFFAFVVNINFDDDEGVMRNIQLRQDTQKSKRYTSSLEAENAGYKLAIQIIESNYLDAKIV